MQGGVSYARITPEGIWLNHDEGPELLPVDAVVLCAGQEPERSLSAFDAYVKAEVARWAPILQAASK
jgi:2,4-dienoyl-CoA reductase (NADPH2)